jgi:hypothetical protein
VEQTKQKDDDKKDKDEEGGKKNAKAGWEENKRKL